MEFLGHNNEFDSNVISEILSRTPLQTLAKCRLLSKECNKITYESTFINVHSKRTKTIYGYFVQGLSNNTHFSKFVSDRNPSSEFSLEFLPMRNVEIVASTNQGILVCIDHESHQIPRYFVCKPSAKQWRCIPNPKTRYESLAIGAVVISSNPSLRYKIVRLSQPKFRKSIDFLQYQCIRCEVFDSVTWEWRNFDEIRLPYGEILDLSPPISASGSLHWLTSDKNVFKFDVIDETHLILTLPEKVLEDPDAYERVKLTPYEGRLGLMRVGKENDSMDLWVLEGYFETMYWTRRRTLMGIQGLIREEVGWADFVGFFNAGVAIFKGYCFVLFFNFNKGCVDGIVKMEKRFGEVGIFPIQSDFEAKDQICEFGIIDLRRRKKRKFDYPLTLLKRYSTGLAIGFVISVHLFVVGVSGYFFSLS